MKLRAGELIALAGIGCTIAALLRPWYETPAGNIGFWDTFGAGAVLMLLALLAAVAMVAAAALERESAAMPVATAGWAVLLGLVGAIAAIVRVLERPQHASGLCGGAWLGLAGAVADPRRRVDHDQRRTSLAVPAGDAGAPSPAVGPPRRMATPWDARTYDRSSGPQQSWAVDVLARLDPIAPDATVLDVGCGTGRVTEALLAIVPAGRVLAIDASEEMVALARERLGDRAEVWCQSALDLELCEEVGAVVSTATLHWVPDHDRLWAGPAAGAAAGRGAGGAVRRRRQHRAGARGDRRGLGANMRLSSSASRPGCSRARRRPRRACSAPGSARSAAGSRSARRVPEDVGEFVRTSILAAHLERLPAERREAFARAVVERVVAAARLRPAERLGACARRRGALEACVLGRLACARITRWLSRPRSTRPGGISYVRVPAGDDARATGRFYEAVFGWTVRDEDADRRSAAFADATGHVIGHLLAEQPGRRRSRDPALRLRRQTSPRPSLGSPPTEARSSSRPSPRAT